MVPLPTEHVNNDPTPAQSPINFEILVLVVDVAQLLLIGMMLDWLLFDGIEVLGLVRLGVVAAVLVGLLKSHGWLILFALQVSLFSREPGRREMVLGVLPWLYSLTSICLVAYAYLGKPFRSGISRWIVTQFLFALGIEDGLSSQSIGNLSSNPEGQGSNWARFFGIQFLVWTAVTFISMLALLRLPISDTVRSEWFRNAIENDFTVWPGATLLVLTLLLIIVFMEAGWRQMTNSQARSFMRSALLLEHYRDLRMIVLRRLKRLKTKATLEPSQKQLVARSPDAH